MFFNSSLLKVFTISHLKCLSISSFKIMDFRFCLWRPVDWNNYAFRALLNFSWTLARNSFLSLLQSNLENVELNNKWGLCIHHLRKCKVFPFIIIIYMIREKTFKFEVFSCFIGVKNIFMTQQNGMIFQLLSRIIIFHYEFSSSSSFRIVFRVR